MLAEQMAETKELSGPELLVLLNPAVEAREVLKVGLKELLARGLLRLETGSRKGLWGMAVPQTRLRLTPGPLPQNPVLQRLLEDLRSARRHGEEMNRVLERLKAEYGFLYTGFKERVVLPHLHTLGLFRPHEQRILGLFRNIRHERTPKGEAIQERLQPLMAQARRIAPLLKDNPAQVVPLMASLGAAALLVPELWPHWGEINALLQRYADGGYAFVTGSTDGSSPLMEDWKSLETSFGELDSSFDASDGGGGDGGGE